jgi:hypothetical protein
MTSSIPAETPEQKARVAKLQQMTPDKNAPLAVFLASDAAKDVTGQIFSPRMNELFVYSQIRRGPTVEQDARFDPAQLGPIVKKMLAERRPDQKMGEG